MIKPDDEEKSLLYVLKNLPIFYWDIFILAYLSHSLGPWRISIFRANMQISGYIPE